MILTIKHKEDNEDTEDIEDDSELINKAPSEASRGRPRKQVVTQAEADALPARALRKRRASSNKARKSDTEDWLPDGSPTKRTRRTVAKPRPSGPKAHKVETSQKLAVKTKAQPSSSKATGSSKISGLFKREVHAVLAHVVADYNSNRLGGVSKVPHVTLCTADLEQNTFKFLKQILLNLISDAEDREELKATMFSVGKHHLATLRCLIAHEEFDGGKWLDKPQRKLVLDMKRWVQEAHA